MIYLNLTDSEKEGLTEDEIELAMARKLEIMILPHLRRSMQFFYAGGDLKGKAKAYRETHNIEFLEDAINQNKAYDTVCKPLCNLVSDILKDNSIKANTVSCDTDMFRHTDVLITTKSLKKYLINYLEDMEMIQTGMMTPDFASEGYYNRRYKKFEGGLTTDGNSLEGISFLPPERLDKIDSNLNYKKFDIYMDEVIKQIRKEFADFVNVMVQNECANIDFNLPQEEKERIKKEIQTKYEMMTGDELLEKKLDWIFNYFNERGDITGHTDFVMYYSRLLLQGVLSNEEYKKLSRYDCFTSLDKIPQDSKISDIIDPNNSHIKNRSHFCIVELNNIYYAFSTKPNCFVKLSAEDIEKVKEYASINKSEKPSDLTLYLCDRGNALPLVFHPLGGEILNERAALIDENLTEEERAKAIKELADSIKTTDEPITSIQIPYPDGSTKTIYIDENDEFVLQEKNKKEVYSFNIEDGKFKKTVFGDER